MTSAQRYAYAKLSSLIDKCNRLQTHALSNLQPLELPKETTDLIREAGEALKQAQRTMEATLMRAGQSPEGEQTS